MCEASVELHGIVPMTKAGVCNVMWSRTVVYIFYPYQNESSRRGSL
jgi:hypothetical protein